jgi:hypothetical protein
MDFVCPAYETEGIVYLSTVQILKWPLGYRAGFSISNDAEYLTLNGWRSLESMFQTIFGNKGLFSTSIFLINPNDEDPAMSLFDVDGSKSQDYEKISELIKVTGSVDGVHAIGNFDKNDFTCFPIKDIVEKTAENFEFSWWSNHGSENNRQNIGSLELQSYQEGDIASSSYYSVNLAKKIGVQYFWLDNNLVSEKSVRADARILQDKEIRDSTLITTFDRFRGLTGKYAPTLESVSDQVSINMLKNLIRKKSGVIVYQHLGISSRDGRSIHSIVESQTDIPSAAIEFFTSLQRFSHKGLWIAKTSVFLKYLDARQNITVANNGDCLILSSSSTKYISLDYISILTKFEVHQVKFQDHHQPVVDYPDFRCIRIGNREFVTVLGKIDEKYF